MRTAAEAAARRLGIEPPLGFLSPAQLRTLAHALEREHLMLGGMPALSLPHGPRFHGNHPAGRRRLELHICALRSANARLRAGQGSGVSSELRAPTSGRKKAAA